MKGCLEINYEPPDGRLWLSGRFCIGGEGVIRCNLADHRFTHESILRSKQNARPK